MIEDRGSPPTPHLERRLERHLERRLERQRDLLVRPAMRALVTGAGGFVGPHLTAHLEGSGDQVVGFDVGAGPDLRDAAAWTDAVARQAPDVIYHLAGWSDVGGSWADPVSTFAINTMGTVSVLEAARSAGTTTVVVVSSADVYGLVSAADLPITEDHPVQPRSPYGASKHAAEAISLQYWRGHGLRTIIARPFNHLGPGQRTSFIAPSFAAQIARAERGEESRLLHGDLSPRRDLTDVRDVVRAYRLLAEHGQPGQAYNVCSGQAIAMEDLLTSMLRLSPAAVDHAVDPGLLRPVDLPALQGSYDKLAAATGWRPEIPIDTTLADVLDDARQRQAIALDR